MKNKITILLATAAIAIAATACSFSTANMSSLKTSKDKDGKQEATSFKGGETIYANAEIANSSDKVTVKFNLMNDKGSAEPGSQRKRRSSEQRHREIQSGRADRLQERQIHAHRRHDQR